MKPLVITAACGFARPQQGGAPETIKEFIQSAVDAWRAGAAIAHVRVPIQIEQDTGRPRTNLNDWHELVGGIREQCDILIHTGIGAMPIERRIEMMEAIRPDFATFMLGHHDVIVRGYELASLRSRADVQRLAQGHVACGVRADYEIFNSGSLWQLQELLGRMELPRPLVLTLFFGWEGGIWSPPDVEEALQRLRGVPPDAEWSVTVVGPEQTVIHALAIARGGHVRVGLGDYPYYLPGRYADSTAQTVARIVRVAAELGRPVATPKEAAEMLLATSVC